MTNTATKAKPAPGTLQASVRNNNGKGANRQLRRDGQIPGVLYGKGQQPMSISLNLNQVTQEYSRGRFRSRLIDIA
ncbi:MAG: hypothetical protein KGJ06_09070, partial [Pseudomonadota bacterium]|nr:hypothetical protein [Pseudomonadota bacterium]